MYEISLWNLCTIVSVESFQSFLSRNYLVYTNTWGSCGLGTSYSVSRNLVPMLNRLLNKWNYAEILCVIVNLHRYVP